MDHVTRTRLPEREVFLKTTMSKAKTKNRPFDVSAQCTVTPHGNHRDAQEVLFLAPDFVARHCQRFIDGVRHILKVDPTLYATILQLKFPVFEELSSNEPLIEPTIVKYWYALLRSVIGQQVSGAAAKTIEQNFCQLFADRDIVPQTVLEIPSQKLRLAGLSASKIKYVQHISQVFSDPQSTLCDVTFYKNDIETITSELLKLKGIGPWLASMFLLFTLKEINVFAAGDLGVARGISWYLKSRPEMLAKAREFVESSQEHKVQLRCKSKFATQKSKRGWTPVHDVYVQYVADQFRPYRSIFMLLMWQLLATNMEVLER